MNFTMQKMKSVTPTEKTVKYNVETTVDRFGARHNAFFMKWNNGILEMIFIQCASYG